MNKKNISKALQAKLKDWINSIDDDDIKSIVTKNAIVTGGALVSLLTGETPNDYDIYFKTYDSCLEVAHYYAKKWNDGAHGSKVEIKGEDGRVTCYIKSRGIAIDPEDSAIDDLSEPLGFENVLEQTIEKPKYRPRYFSTNAISLSDQIQLVIRFYGSVEEIHTNYDFAHCTCSFDYISGKVVLPEKALECIINKELFYEGSKYPLCSIIRSRKFITRGWHINAGQYLKMCLQLNELDLKDINVFQDQLAGVDSAYFEQAIVNIKSRMEENPEWKADNTYLFELINRIF